MIEFRAVQASGAARRGAAHTGGHSAARPSHGDTRVRSTRHRPFDQCTSLYLMDLKAFHCNGFSNAKILSQPVKIKIQM